MRRLGVAFLLLWSSAVFGQGGTWTLTGTLAEPRRDHSATLLVSGKVLIVGYYSTTAELYDPASGAFTMTGPPLYVHGAFATATRLLDGRVLIAGGDDALTSAEIYDPASGTFYTAGSMNTPRFAHAASLLSDGRVLIAGGQDNSLVTTAAAELYDPVTNTFTPTGSLHTDRTAAAAAPLPNGSVLIVGGSQPTPGMPGFRTCVAAVEIYEPQLGTFRTGGNLLEAPCGLWSISAPVLPSGKVFILSGFTAQLFEPATETIRYTGSPLRIQVNPSATRLSDGRILIAGGFFNTSKSNGPVAVSQIYDPATETFVADTSMNVPREQHTHTLLPSGKVLITGGFGGTTSFDTSADLDSAELFTPNHAPVVQCRNATLVASSACSASIGAADVVSTAFDIDGDAVSLSLNTSGPFAIGTHSVVLTATDTHGASASCAATVDVVDRTAPAITGISATPESLRPPNRQMVDVTIDYATSDACSGPVSTMLSVSSSDPVTGTGDSTSPDWEVIDAHHVRLRAEVAPRMAGRTYSIQITATDSRNNSATAVIRVPVELRR